MGQEPNYPDEPVDAPSWFFKATELESPITELALLLVGRDGHLNDALGSGVFIAPGLGMTAKHVVEEFWKRMGSGVEFAGERSLEGHFQIMAVQYPNESSEAALWLATFVWGARFTDIAFISFTPTNDLAKLYAWPKRPKLNLLPPTIGERVVGFGYPTSQATEVEGGRLQLALHPSTTGGRVTNVYEEYRDRGMLKFPCFEINAYFVGGMSGGPLFKPRLENLWVTPVSWDHGKWH